MHTHVQIYYVAMYECTIRSSDNITTEKIVSYNQTLQLHYYYIILFCLLAQHFASSLHHEYFR